ncbi:unnamed protein product, partial [Brassica napus]
LKSEIWGWTLFYAAISGLAFGSGYYHLKPDDNGIFYWLVCTNGKIALFLFISFFNVAYASQVQIEVIICVLVDGRVFNDLRLYMTFQLIPCLAIPLITVLLPPKYTHSRLWLLATAAHSVSKINGYIIGGYSLGHLCSALAMLLLTVMLLYRSIRFQRRWLTNYAMTLKDELDGGEEKSLMLLVHVFIFIAHLCSKLRNTPARMMAASEISLYELKPGRCTRTVVTGLL